MSTSFNPTQRLIVVRGDVEGPAGAAVFRLVLDTGSTRTVLDRGLAASIGIRPDANMPLVAMTAVTGTAHVAQTVAQSFAALEQVRQGLPILIHDLPAARFDGVLGLDFLRGHELNIDFHKGEITLS